MKKTKLIKAGKTYQQRKAEARDEAINWQAEFPDHNYSWGELAAWDEGIILDYWVEEENNN